MKVKIPKELVGASYPTVMTIELNNFNTDTFLPALFFKIMSRGRTRVKGKDDQQTIRMYVEKLVDHPLLMGFQTPDGHRVLEKFVRTSLITTSSIGLAKRGEQILALTPYSLLSYKPELPASSSRHRGVDTFIYHALREYMGAGAGTAHAQNILKDCFVSFFGKGLVFQREPSMEATYDEQTELDTITRMSLAFIDGFNAAVNDFNKASNEYNTVNNELNINKLANSIGVSSHQLSQFINRTYDKKFYDFINFYRVEEAKVLLTDTSKNNLKIEAIGEAAGFNSRATFFSVFKKFTGKTPSVFKKDISN